MFVFKNKLLVFASGNQSKAREMAALLKPLGLEVKLQAELGIASPEETGKSFLENALLKARHASEQSGLAAIADDSGLCVDALNGAPGIYSARFCGRHGDDRTNYEKLLKLLDGRRSAERRACYWCALCLWRFPDDPVPLVTEASWEGRIALQPAGSGGFGYDPVFEVTGRGCTAAQLPPQLKNLISHRGRAMAAMAELIKIRLASG